MKANNKIDSHTYFPSHHRPNLRNPDLHMKSPSSTNRHCSGPHKAGRWWFEWLW